jgi:hypothetical protein
MLAIRHSSDAPEPRTGPSSGLPHRCHASSHPLSATTGKAFGLWVRLKRPGAALLWSRRLFRATPGPETRLRRWKGVTLKDGPRRPRGDTVLALAKVPQVDEVRLTLGRRPGATGAQLATEATTASGADRGTLSPGPPGVYRPR